MEFEVFYIEYKKFGEKTTKRDHRYNNWSWLIDLKSECRPGGLIGYITTK